jgi:DNA-binding phage protein
MTADQIRSALADRNIKAVAKATGLSRGTIHRFLKGGTEPHRATLVVLESYLMRRADG